MLKRVQKECSYVNTVKRGINTSSTPLIILINESRLRLHSTIGILSESDAGVFISTEMITILGDLEVKATNQTTNITQQVDSLIRLQSNMELRVNTFAQHANMGVVCDPEAAGLDLTGSVFICRVL
ncbi:unnamed protein product [Bathycoccus prasinos]